MSKCTPDLYNAACNPKPAPLFRLLWQVPLSFVPMLACVLQAFKNDPQLQQLPHTVIASWYQRRGYVTAMADLIQQSLQQFQEQVPPLCYMASVSCLSYHSRRAQGAALRVHCLCFLQSRQR